ncbi:acetoacetate--CoA ligase (plasmid) [Paraburkholderia sp. PREW-6R]|uniref:acetoacetate--CoA ligase n=1 Tax=Paraburkholderia sp. PREW-6R TaxID=3141544 RepID=UPI0031F4C167
MDRHCLDSRVGRRVALPASNVQPGIATQMSAFAAALETHTGLHLADYARLHEFSTRDYRTFWNFFVDWCNVCELAGSPEPVCVGDECEHACFFPALELNYADCLLSLDVADAHAAALSECHADAPRLRMTRGELRDRVARLACSLERLGLRSGDRVTMVARNDAQAIISALAVVALGATLSTAAPEMAAEAVLDRFQQLSPRLLFAHTAPRAFDTGPARATSTARVAAALPSLEGIISLDDGPLPADMTLPIYSLATLISESESDKFVWRRFPFNHPLFIMFSSGTTGKPKCIVHGAGGTLIEHLKEHRLHTDLRAGDTLYFQTSCAWMMWNWQLSALASGVEIVTYDGPLATVDTLWRIAAEESANVFGTSPAYLKMCEQARLEPARQFDLSALRAILSTGAVLYDSQYDWVNEHVGPMPLQSISGGTDIIGCFVLGNPDLPVYKGAAQCKSLGLDVQAWTNGAPASGVGHLVCTNPFPSRPLGFFGDAEGARFHAAYFAANPGVWTHGDLIEFPAEGGARMHGRADGMLNVGGVKVGPAEIYRILNEIPGIQDAMIVDPGVTVSSSAAARNGNGATPVLRERRFVLLLVLQTGVAFSGALLAQIRRDLVRRASAAHVPGLILAVDALPTTHSGKPSETAARDAINGVPVRNAGALRNPECLETISRLAAQHLGKRALPSSGNTRAELEAYLRAVWERMFGFQPISRDANFFDLGGDSLLAAEMTSEIENATGSTISFANLMTAPTLAQIADVIESGSPASSDALVLMRAGTGAPVFLAHSVTGSVMECRALIGALRGERPIYGLNAQGLDGRQPPQHRVADMARSYLAQIRLMQPHGPYTLAGYSFGGLIALEIAQQLYRLGDPVELLCLLDTYVSERYLPWGARMKYRGSYVARHWQMLRRIPAMQRAQYVSGKLGAAMGRLRSRRGSRTSSGRETDAVGLPPALQGVREAMYSAMAAYRPRRYRGGPIFYVRASVQQERRGDPLPLWQQVACAGLQVVDVGGGHNDMLFEPNASVIASMLDEALAAPPSRTGSQDGRTALHARPA